MEDEPKSDVKVWSEQWRPHAVAVGPGIRRHAGVLGPAAGHVWAFAFSPDGTEIVAAIAPSEDLAASHGNVRLLRWRVDGTGGERELLQPGRRASQVPWAADGARIVVVGAQLPEPSHHRVFLIDAADDRSKRSTRARRHQPGPLFRITRSSSIASSARFRNWIAPRCKYGSTPCSILPPAAGSTP